MFSFFFSLNFLFAAVDLAWKSFGDCTVCKGNWSKDCNQLTSGVRLFFFSNWLSIKRVEQEIII